MIIDLKYGEVLQILSSLQSSLNEWQALHDDPDAGQETRRLAFGRGMKIEAIMSKVDTAWKDSESLRLDGE